MSEKSKNVKKWYSPVICYHCLYMLGRHDKTVDEWYCGHCKKTVKRYEENPNTDYQLAICAKCNSREVGQNGLCKECEGKSALDE